MESFLIKSPHDKLVAKEYISKLPDGKIYDVVVKLHRNRRSIPQNRLLHLWFKCIEEETGQDAMSIKRFFKEMFLGYQQVEVFQRKSYALPSTASLNTLQMTDFINKISAWTATELGIVLPVPEDLYFAQFVERYKDK